MDPQQEKTKARSKNYSQEEINTLVDLVQENKSKLFGSLSASLTFEEKASLWDQIAQDLTSQHGVYRSRDDVTKKWSDLLCKHKPLIADKIKSVRNTGGGPADAELTSLEEKIHSIRGKETFEGISCGIEISAEPQSSQQSDQMLIDPSISFDGEAAAVSRKRKHPQLVTSFEMDDTKRILIAKEDEKLALSKEIKENFVSIGNVLELLPEMVQNQATMINLLAQQSFPFVTPGSRFPTNFPPGNVP